MGLLLRCSFCTTRLSMRLAEESQRGEKGKHVSTHVRGAALIPDPNMPPKLIVSCSEEWYWCDNTLLNWVTGTGVPRGNQKGYNQLMLSKQSSYSPELFLQQYSNELILLFTHAVWWHHPSFCASHLNVWWLQTHLGTSRKSLLQKNHFAGCSSSSNSKEGHQELKGCGFDFKGTYELIKHITWKQYKLPLIKSVCQMHKCNGSV